MYSINIDVQKTERIFDISMAQQPVTIHEQDLIFARSVLSVNTQAATELRVRYHGRIVSLLCARGASSTEAEDLVADLWSDCFQSPRDRPTLLAKYQGRCALESWLMTVATNRLIDLKRRQSFRVDLPSSDQSPNDFFDRRPHPQTASADASVLKLLRGSIQNAFARRNSESVLMLKLVHLYQLTQREIARMWGWHESKVSRALEQAREGLARDILTELKRTDPWLELQWEDFLELCQGSADSLFR